MKIFLENYKNKSWQLYKSVHSTVLSVIY